MAMFNMYKNFEYLCPDAPDTISQLLLTGEYPLVRPRTVLGTIATHCSRGAGARTLHTSTRPWRCWLPCARNWLGVCRVGHVHAAQRLPDALALRAG
jgi:hypothetical protein